MSDVKWNQVTQFSDDVATALGDQKSLTREQWDTFVERLKKLDEQTRGYAAEHLALFAPEL